MAEQQEQRVAVDTNLYFNMQKTYTDDEGHEHYGVWEEGWRDPDTHVIHFDDAPPEAGEAGGSSEASQVDQAVKVRAYELGVNLVDVPPTGGGGVVTVNDVEAYAANTQ